MIEETLSLQPSGFPREVTSSPRKRLCYSTINRDMPQHGTLGISSVRYTSMSALLSIHGTSLIMSSNHRWITSANVLPVAYSRLRGIKNSYSNDSKRTGGTEFKISTRHSWSIAMHQLHGVVLFQCMSRCILPRND